MWIIPLTTGRRRILFPGVERAAMALGFAQARPLNFALKPARFAQFMNSVLEREGEPHLAAVVRTDVGVQPVSMTHMEQNMKSILSHPLVKRFQFVRPAEAMALLTHGHRGDRLVEKPTAEHRDVKKSVSSRISVI